MFGYPSVALKTDVLVTFLTPAPTKILLYKHKSVEHNTAFKYTHDLYILYTYVHL